MTTQAQGFGGVGWRTLLVMKFEAKREVDANIEELKLIKDKIIKDEVDTMVGLQIFSN